MFFPLNESKIKASKTTTISQNSCGDKVLKENEKGDGGGVAEKRRKRGEKKKCKCNEMLKKRKTKTIINVGKALK